MVMRQAILMRTELLRFSPQISHPEQLKDKHVSHSARQAPHVNAVATALPGNYVNQESLSKALTEFWRDTGVGIEACERLHKSTTVSGRYLALQMHEYRDLNTLERSNAAWMRVAPQLGSQAAQAALSHAGLDPADIDHLFSVTGTGIATPSIDTRIIGDLGMKSEVKRSPIFGLGCAGGVAGIARAADYLRAFPNERALLLAIELCSVTLQLSDTSLANQIASGLFGDGAAAVVLSGSALANAGAPQVLGSRSVLYPHTERVMGWDIVDRGFKIVMSPAIPELVRQHVAQDVDGFLAQYQLERGHIKHWIAHTGGPKVLRAIEAGLALPRSALQRSWDSLCRMGNLSSASVLFVFAELLEAKEQRPGDYGLMLGLGPGFCLELVLLQW
jgi:alkylresorcinol/alkylpyrone synthase